MWSRALAVVAVVTGAGCNQLFGLDSVAVDADGGGGEIDAAPLPPWSVPTPIAGVSSAVTIDEDPEMSHDGLELYLARRSTTAGLPHDIIRYVRSEPGLPWISAPPIETINSTETDWTPRLSTDDLTMYFASTRDGLADVWTAKRGSLLVEWGAPSALSIPPLNGPAEERGAMPCNGGSRFVFTSLRSGTLDLFEIPLGGAATPILGASDAGYAEISPFISEDCLTLYFSSTEFGDPDLMVMTRTGVDAPWTSPQPIPALSTEDHEGDPWVSADGRHLVLAIDVLPVDGDYDLYESFR